MLRRGSAWSAETMTYSMFRRGSTWSTETMICLGEDLPGVLRL